MKDETASAQRMVPAGSPFILQPSTLAPAPAIHDCWNQIGVMGNGTCRELVKNIHCRNCAVYMAAGLQLLDRALPAEYRRERAVHYAPPKQLSHPARVSAVIFRLGVEWLALPTIVFQEVAERRTLHTLPHRRGGLALGLVNVRGELVICATVARLLGVEENTEILKTVRPQSGYGRDDTRAERTTYGSGGRNISSLPESGISFSRLLVTSWKGQRVAFPVAEVFGIQRFSQAELKAPPATIARSVSTCMQGVFEWRDRTVGLLDAEVFFSTLNRNLA